LVFSTQNRDHPYPTQDAYGSDEQLRQPRLRYWEVKAGWPQEAVSTEVEMKTIPRVVESPLSSRNGEPDEGEVDEAGRT
jgi:hypothetical protein